MLAHLPAIIMVGTWKNELGSTLTITTYSATYPLRGYYVSPQSTSGAKYPATGWVNASQGVQAVLFTVNWGVYGTITSWVGYCENSTIKTMWNLVKSNAGIPDWQRVLTNSDTFKPVVGTGPR